ncbi:sensor histidine kinase [Kocuria varians]|uniref:histidine kinase n=2 Tax=Kocuria TaxID=57493 RepID=A0A7D7Q2Y7_KOCVA|nr:histidine kinase [Kocuria varians]QMS55578.1 Oxygen sensor histidine kinase NreB [Kocuria varians]
MPNWLRIVVLLFAALALLDDLRSVDWQTLTPLTAILTAGTSVLSYGAVALLAWSPKASTVVIVVGYAASVVPDEYAAMLLGACVVMVGVVAMLPRRTVALFVATSAAWIVVVSAVSHDTRFVWALGLPLGVCALFGVALRFFLTQYRLNARRLAVLEVTHQQLREQERLALARDLHDVVAHELTLVTMQAAGSQREQDPAALHRTIDAMDTAARSGLQELRILLQVLRDSPGPAGPARPQAGGASGLTTGSLGDIARTLASNLEHSGLHPEFTLDDGAARLPTTVRGTAARVMQEATTNMIKYAPAGSHCEMQVSTSGSCVHVHARNPVRRGARPAGEAEAPGAELTSGFGLPGIRERVALLDGSVEYGAHDAAWCLDVRIPFT